MDKVKTFEKELEYIVDDNIKESSKTMIELLPDYFFMKQHHLPENIILLML